MADLSVTAGSVVPTSTTIVRQGIAGAAITAGQTVYLDSSTSTYKLADSNGATAAVAATKGVALNGASSGQPIDVATGGDINPGATVAVGAAYAQSTTPGGIAAIADVTAGQYMTVIGVGTTTSNLKISLIVSGVVKA